MLLVNCLGSLDANLVEGVLPVQLEQAEREAALSLRHHAVGG